MTAEEWLESVRECAAQISSHAALLEHMRSQLGPHERGARFGRATYLDPMRRVDEYLDAETESSQIVADCQREVDRARLLVAGIESLGGDDAAQVITRRYLRDETWEQIAREMGHAAKSCELLCRRTCRWIDSVGMARLIELGADADVDGQ